MSAGDQEKALGGKNVLVTGAARGIGRSVALRAAASGANILFTYNASEEAAQKVREELSSYGVAAEALRVDVCDREQVRDLVARAKAFEGGVNCLVNNAGIRKDAALFMMMQDEAWDEVLNVNLGGFYNVTRALVPVFMRAKRGSVVNIASVSGLYAVPGQTNYAATKAGMIGFTRCLAREVGKVGVRINCVAPGYIETDMTQSLPPKRRDAVLSQIALGRMGDAMEVAHVVHFLLSDESAYVTGQTFVVDGGLTL